MNSFVMTARNFGIIVVKNAVNALIVNVGAWLILPANFNLHDKAAVWNVVKLAGIAVGSREAAVVVPMLLKWSQTPTTLVQEKLAVAQEATKEAVVATKVAESAVAEAKAVAPPPKP